jgi:UDP-N-acetylglucosamine 2-epimerase (non-hydrolysing)
VSVVRRLKVMTLVGTRPELIKLSRVLHELERHTDHRLVHSGQNYDYELNEVFFQELGIPRPAIFLEAVGATPAETIGRVIAAFDAVLEEEQPDAVLIYGDTNTGLGVIAAKRRRVPVFHMEAGNRCFDQRVPEELNRKVIDHLSDVNMTTSEHARRYLLREGLRPETVIVTGSPMTEVLEHYRPGIEKSDVVERLGLVPGDYFLVSAHREENVDDAVNLLNLVAILRAVGDRYGKPIVVSTHPRTRQRLSEAGLDDGADLPAEFLKPFGFCDYARLETESRCVLSDSGTLMEEAAILGFPAVMIREAHERPEGMDAGVLIFSGMNPERVLQAIDIMTTQSPRPSRIPAYDVPQVSTTVVRIITSYVDHVNRTVWQKRAEA